MTKDPVKVRAARIRWDAVTDRSAATLRARQASRRSIAERILAEVDPDGLMTPEERAERVREGRAAHFRKLALLRHGRAA